MKYSLKEALALATTVIDGTPVSPDKWDAKNSPRVDKEKFNLKKDFLEKLGLTAVKNKNGTEVCIDHMDPQYKREISIFTDPADNVIKHKEPNFYNGHGEHKIAELGYSELSDKNNAFKTEFYLYPYDPNWNKSKQIIDIIIQNKDKDFNTINTFLKDPDLDNSIIKKEWNELKNSLHEDNNDNKLKFYHGTNLLFEPGDIIKSPIETGNISEKGRKRNLDKVFFTTDVGSAKIYAGRARPSLGSGKAYIYMVEPLGDIEWLNKNPGTTVAMAPKAKVIKRIK